MQKLISAVSAAAILALGFAATPAHATTPASTYSFEMDGDLNPSVGSATITPATACSSPAPTDLCNIATNFGSDSNGNYWHWRTTQVNGGGAVLDTVAQLGTTYSLYIKFAIDEQADDTSSSGCSAESENYGKIMHFRDRTNDYGLYAQGCDNLYISTGYDWSNSRFGVGDVMEFVIARDGSNDTLKVFVNTDGTYEEAFTYSDASGDFIAVDQMSGSRVSLFQNDENDGTNEGIQEGRLYGMKAWPGTALTIDQLDGLVTVTSDSNSSGSGNGDSLAPTGSNATISLSVILLAVVAAAGAVVVRRRKA